MADLPRFIDQVYNARELPDRSGSNPLYKWGGTGVRPTEPAFLRPDLGDVDVEEADRVNLELPPYRLVALDLTQA